MNKKRPVFSAGFTLRDSLYVELTFGVTTRLIFTRDSFCFLCFCGAGAGGFLLFYVEPENQDQVRMALRELKELPMNLQSSGSKIVHFDRE